MEGNKDVVGNDPTLLQKSPSFNPDHAREAGAWRIRRMNSCLPSCQFGRFHGARSRRLRTFRLWGTLSTGAAGNNDLGQITPERVMATFAVFLQTRHDTGQRVLAKPLLNLSCKQGT